MPVLHGKSIPHQGNIFPVAGGHVGDGLTGPNAALSSPNAVALSGTSVYIADTEHCRVRRIDNAGITSTVAGTGTCGFAGNGGAATSANLNHPKGVAFIGNDLYISDTDNCRVRKVVAGANSIVDGASDETITTYAGTGTCGFAGDGAAATLAQLNLPSGLAAGSDLYIADAQNCVVRMVDHTSLNISTVAGTGSTCGFAGDGGIATSAQLNKPAAVAVSGSNLYIADTDNCRVRKVVVGGNISLYAGTGTCGFAGDGAAATLAQLNKPAGVVVGGTDLYIADTDNCRVRNVTGGNITLYAGTGTCGYNGDNTDPTLAQLNHPTGLAYGSSTLYLADRDNHRVRKIGSPIATVAGTGLPSFCGDSRVAVEFSCLSSPRDVVVDPSGNIYIADAGNHRVRKISTANISTFAGKTDQTSCPTDSGADATTLCLANPQHLAVSPSDLYISDRDGHTIWRINLGSGAFSRVAGNGTPGLCADNTSSLGSCVDLPAGLEVQQVSGTDTYLFVAEEGNAGRVLRVNLLTNTIRTVLNDTYVSTDVAVGPDGSLYVAEPIAGFITRVDPDVNGIVDGPADAGEYSAVVAGGGGTDPITDGTVPTDASLDYPSGVEIDKADTDGEAHLLISERDHNHVWVVTPGTVTKTIVDGESGERIWRIAGGAGTPAPGFCNDSNPDIGKQHNARTACLNLPADLSYDDVNLALYFADRGNDRVRKIPSDCDSDGLTDKDELTPPDPLTDPCDSDTDNDVCSDGQELGPDPSGGGQRDPTNPWDFFNPAHTGIVLSADITLEVNHYGHQTSDGPPGYSTDYDRSSLLGGHPWQFDAPDGIILSLDITAAVNSYGHDCRTG